MHMNTKRRLIGILTALIIFASAFPAALAAAPEYSVEAAVKLNKKTLTLTEGETYKLKLSTSKSTEWLSSKPDVASVSDSGLVTALSEGSCKVYAIVGSKTYTCKVTVKAGEVRSRFSSQTIEKAVIDKNYKNLFDEKEVVKALDNRINSKIGDKLTWISMLTRDGAYGYFDDKTITAKTLQKNIKTVEDVLAYFVLSGYSYYEDDQGYMNANYMGWNLQNSALVNIYDNCGVCNETAMVVNYLLEGDYEETGTVFVTSEHGHAYNYIFDDGIYYLIDFTDFTSNHPNVWNESERRSWLKSICFWSGESLDSAEATKAVCIHDTYEEGNLRTSFNAEWTKHKTGAILAIKYYNGMEGKTPSMLCDYAYQGNLIEKGLSYGDGRKYRPSRFGVGVPEGTKYTMMYLNPYEDGYCGAPWFEMDPVPIEKCPWFVDVPNDVKSKETCEEKFKRQSNVDNYINYDEITAAVVWRIQFSWRTREELEAKYKESEVQEIMQKYLDDINAYCPLIEVK